MQVVGVFVRFARRNTSSQMLLQFVLEWRLLWERYCCAGAAGKRSALPIQE
jgi:hypothetical protein